MVICLTGGMGDARCEVSDGRDAVGRGGRERVEGEGGRRGEGMRLFLIWLVSLFSFLFFPDHLILLPQRAFRDLVLYSSTILRPLYFIPSLLFSAAIYSYSLPSYLVHVLLLFP